MRNARAEGAIIPLQNSRTPFRLSSSQFKAGQQVLNRRSPVASYRVPRDTILELDGDAPARLAVRAAVPFTVENRDRTTENRPVIDLSSVTPVRSTRPAPSNPSTAHPDVTVVVDGQERQIVSYDAEAKTVEFIDPAGSGATSEDITGVAYVAHADGDFRLVAVMPSGVDVREIEVYADTFEALHTTDQADAESGLKLGRGELLPLGPEWELQLQVNSAASIEWSAAAKHLLDFRAYTVKVSILDRAKLNQIIAGRLL